MARTATEARIVEKRKAKGIVVPILEQILERPLEIEDDEDIAFMLKLMQERARPREKGVFSPSMLSSCMRKSYFAKTGQEKKWAKSPRTNAYFIDGNFRHLKWQFALWKAHRAGLLVLLGVEVRVFHPSGDYAGTIDAVVEINGEIFIIDFKGMNVNDFQLLERDGSKFQHRVQIVGYALIANLDEKARGGDKEVTRCLLVGENKGGPTQKGSPIALYEDVVEVSKHRREVKTRIAHLRKAVTDEKIPEPACTSIRTKTFQECPFAWYCRDEVREIQQRAESPGRKNPAGRTVKISQRTGTDRTGKRASGRKINPA
jgi:hypothetical protein